MADAPAEAPAPKKKPSLGKQVTSGVRRTVGGQDRAVVERVKRLMMPIKENLKASSPMTSSLWYLLKHPLIRSLLLLYSS